MRAILFALLLGAGQASVIGSTWYASPDGAPTGTGEIFSPLSLITALSTNGPARAGDTVMLLGGTYGLGGSYVFGSTLIGTEANPITVRQAPGVRAVIDGGIWAGGEWVTWMGFEIMNSSTNRTCTSEERPQGIGFYGPGHKAVNLVIHDVGQPAIGAWRNVGDGGEIYGCVMWGNGLYCTDPGAPDIRGTAIYAQNDTGSRYITDNISFKNWSGGMKAYAESVRANGFEFEGNVNFGNYADGILIDTLHEPITYAKVMANVSYNNGSDRLGMTAIGHTNIVIGNNHWIMDSIGDYTLIEWNIGWQDLTMTNNVFAQLATTSTWADTCMLWKIERGGHTYTVNRNDYYSRGIDSQSFNVDDGQRLRWDAMRAMTGWEANGTYHTNALPASNVVILRPNKYEPGRANVTVLNWEGKATETINLAQTGLPAGQAYRIRDAQNWLGTPLATGVYNPASPTVQVSLTSTNVTPIIGEQTHFTRDPNAHTPSLFNVFVVERVLTPTVPPRAVIQGAKVRKAKI